MLKSRFGEDFVNRLSGNLDVKAPEASKKDNRVNKRRGGDKKDRAPRPQKERK